MTTSQKQTVSNWEKLLKNGELIELTNSEMDHAFIFKGYNDSKCLMFNGKVIKSVKTWMPILIKTEMLNLI